MFRKPFQIKSNTQLKGSERKTFKDNVTKSFPGLSEVDLDSLMSKKDLIHNIKVVTFSNNIVNVYVIQKCAVFFVVRGVHFPTIHLLWRFPKLVYAFTTHKNVLENIGSGADLMLPGVVTPPHQSGLPKYGNLQEGDIACVNTTCNKAAIAVGITARSSNEMAHSGGKGKCLIIHHFLGDHLCNFEGNQPGPMPQLGPQSWLQLTSYNDDFPALGGAPAVRNQTNRPIPDKPPENLHENIRESSENDVESSEPVDTQDETQNCQAIDVSDNMDQLLTNCFFTAIKYSKTLTLPILTSTFYKLQMLPVCPEGQTLNIKQSSYKKLKTFLDFMCREGVISVNEPKKGVEQIVSINKDHPMFCQFYVDPLSRPKKPEEKESTASTTVTESYIITPLVAPIFEGLAKGDAIASTVIRKHVTEFVKKNNYQDSEDKRLVKPAGALAAICRTENKITWEELMEKVCERMRSCYKVSSGIDEIVNKGKVAPITLRLSRRAANKKVTLVDNLELFGIRLFDFAKECQHGVAAHTSISRPPGGKTDQLLVQGNQILFIYNLLIEKYKIPQKYIKDVENIPKKKKPDNKK